MRASGESGVLRVGYQEAARLGAWSLVIDAQNPRAQLRARVLSEHPHWIKQRPIDVVVHLATVEWIWRDVSFTREGADLVATIAEKPISEPYRVVSTGG